MSRRGPIRLATRGSALALSQAREVQAALEDRRFEVDLVEVETEGDRVRDELIENLGTTGAFVRSLDERVLDGDVDAALHSLKDVPTEMPDDVVMAALPRRGPPGDVLVTPDGSDLDELPRGAVVGTSSQRRRAELLAHRSDLTVEPLRGNVDTRVEKLLAPALQSEHERRLAAEEEDGEETEAFERSAEKWFDDLAEIERRALGREVDVEYDAVVLAEAGLRRSGLLGDVPTRRLPMGEFVPAPGQGALVLTCLPGDTESALRTALDHECM
jgi:hydroxymethylbilane synthase